jgi:murein DD-endopeptidase MepM/ murein hydrolase activator NlpD
VHDWLAGHRGVDLLAFAGDAVRAAGPGMVVFAGPVGGRGVVTVLHDDGRRTTYEPISPEVGIGDVVETGQLIGRVHEGAGHCGDLPSCLHWGLLRGEEYLDPMSLLSPGRPSLLPWMP